MEVGKFWNPLPPGAVFAWTSEEVTEWFGVAIFDIPESATLKTLLVPYSCKGAWRVLECEPKTAVAHLGDYEGPAPIDESYGARIYQAGEGIDIGGVASVKVTSGDGGGSSNPLIFALDSLHAGYTLKIDEVNFGFLHSAPSVISMGFSSVDLEGPREVGPMQAVEIDGELDLEGRYWPTPVGQSYWLFGHIELKEDSPTGASTEINFVVELP